MWGNIDLIGMIWDFLGSLSDTMLLVYNWLFSDIGIGSYSVKPIYLVGGATFLVLIGLWLVKKIVGV